MPITYHEWGDPNVALRTAAALGSDEVQVWLARPPAAEAGMAGLTGLLGRDERERAERYRADEARQHFVFGRALLRLLLAACLNVEPAALEFAYQPHGKPILVFPHPEENPRFNLSHSGGLLAIALARGRDVGIDIESMGAEAPDWLPLAARVFSPRELGELTALPAPHLQRRAFFTGWTRKEAYLKATGEGLIDALEAIEVTLTPGQAPALLKLPASARPPREWSIRDIPMPPDFAGAVVYSSFITT